MMKNKPLFSVITINWNMKNDLEKTIKNVTSQTFKDFEYIVIDGGSSDGSVDVIKKYKDKIGYWVSEKDNGIYNAMNKGAKAANGEYMIFMNAGDIFANTDILNKVSEKIKGMDLLYGCIRVVSKIRKSSRIVKRKPNKLNVKFGEKVSQQAVFIKRSMFTRVKGLNEKYRIASDYDLLCKVFEISNKVEYLDIIVCDYDDGGQSANLKKSYMDTASVIKDRYGIMYSLIYFFIYNLKLLIVKVLKWK